MNIEILKSKPIWQMSGEEFLFLQGQTSSRCNESVATMQTETKNHVYGYKGIAELFGCSKSTAARIKLSGDIDGAITQIGRKIIVDAELALQLAGKKKGGRN